MTHLSSNWVRKVEEMALIAKKIPLWGSFPDIDWDSLEQTLAKTLDVSSLKFLFQKSEVVPKHRFQEGFAQHPMLQPIALSPFPSAAFILINPTDIRQLIRSLLPSSHDHFSDPDFEQGFFLFLLALCLENLSEEFIFQDFSPLLLSQPPAEIDDEGICIDFKISSEKWVLPLRIICPLSLHRALHQEALKRPPVISSALRSELELSLIASIGEVTLQTKEWNKLSIGDFIILDRCFYNPFSSKGSAILFLESQPLFRTRIKADSLKITDYAFYYETGDIMEKDRESDFSQEDHFEGDNLEEREELDEEPLDDYEDEEEEEFEDLNAPETPPQQQLSDHLTQASLDIPMTLTVEVGRISMSLEKVLQLQPGNLLEISLQPQQGVWLTVQGKRVASGELLSIGDVMGVKILQLL
jgi:flagellar motor switch protein FliN